MYLHFLWAAVAAWSLGNPSTSIAQQWDISCREDSTKPEVIFMPFDAMANATPYPSSTTTSTRTFHSKDPFTAAILSIIPGAGQLYIESYWKAPVFFAGFAAAIGFAVYNNNQVNLLSAQLADGNVSLSFRDALLRQREIFRDLRDISILAAVGVAGLAAIDAYTGAHLFDFDVSDEWSGTLHISPRYPALCLTFRCILSFDYAPYQ